MLHEMFDVLEQQDTQNSKSATFIKRRNTLLAMIAKEYPGKQGKVFLFSPFESARNSFVQESSFYYYSGISEPASALVFDSQHGSQLYVPDFGGLRNKWVESVDVLTEETVSLFGIDELKKLGNLVKGYELYPYFSADDYQGIINLLIDLVAQKQTIFTLYPLDKYQYASVKQIIDRLEVFIPGLKHHIVDISPLVASMRRKKDIAEVETMYQSVEITNAAFQAAVRMLKPGVKESELQAAMEYIFIENGASKAYPLIVAGGSKSTVLHYHRNNQVLQEQDLVLIDAGAMYQHYCADITRTFPVSGKFDQRQKDIYSIVLEAQAHVVSHIKPGMWLSNEKEQDASLHHIAVNFFKKKGYDSYFNHGIGHFLGLDVHDVGDRSKPLEEGDVITVEPGLYLPEESIGVRMEDNYWVMKDADPVCLSESIPKGVEDVEKMVEDSFDIDVI